MASAHFFLPFVRWDSRKTRSIRHWLYRDREYSRAPMFALRTHLVSTVAGTSPDVQPVPTPLLEPAAATEEEGEEVMAFSRRMEFFLDDKWVEEDGDGFNLIIIDERRRLCQERMEEYLKDFATD